MFQNPKGNALGLLPVRIGKRPVWKQNGAEYQIKFRDRSFIIKGKIGTDNLITAVTKGEDNLLESKNGFVGDSLKDPKPDFNSRNFLVPFTWLTASPNGSPKWASEIKAEGLDLCNPLEDPSKQSPWFP